MVPKDVIFVIDVSGSMIGTKIKQVKWTNFTDYLPRATALGLENLQCSSKIMWNFGR